MSKKPDYEKMETVEEVEEEVSKHKDTLVRQLKLRSQTKEAKKEAASAYNEQLKECEEALDFHVEVIDELNRHKKLILAKQDGKNSRLKSIP